MERLKVAREVATALNAAEQAIDAALRRQSLLVARLVAARGEARLSATLGDAALARAVAGVTALARARGETVACHAELAQVQAQLGIGAVDVGQGDKDPPESAPAHKPRACARRPG